MSADRPRSRSARAHAGGSVRHVTTLVAALALALLAAPAALGAQGASAHVPASRPTIEREVMCVTCKIPLQVAESEQANLEREYIQSLVEKGYDEAQIKRALVAQYGPSVLALPSTHGFDLAAYLVPLAVVLALLATVAVLLPRWRSRSRGQPGAAAKAPPLSAADEARLEADLTRFDR